MCSRGQQAYDKSVHSRKQLQERRMEARMKVTEKTRTARDLVLEVVASPADVEMAFEAALLSFAQLMGLQPEGSKTIAQVGEEKLGIRDLDAVVEPQVVEYLTPLAVDKKNLMPAYPAQVLKKSVARRGSELSFVLKVALKTGLVLSSYEPVTISLPPLKIAEEKIDEQISLMAQSYAEFAEIEPRPALMGDSCLINLRAEHEGRDIPELTVEKAIYNLGSHQISDDFEGNLVGMSASETKEFVITGPDYVAQVNGRPIECIVDVIEVRERRVPEINDAWIMLNAPEAKTLEGFKDSMRQAFMQNYALEYEATKRQLASAELAKRFSGDIADEAILAMQENIVMNIKKQLSREERSFDEYVSECGGEQQFNLSTMIQSKDNLAQGYALDAFFLHAKLALNDADILEACKTIDSENPELIRKQMEYSGCGYMLQETAERLKASKVLLEQAEIVELAS